MERLPTYFISHGGGPWPWLPDMRRMLHSLEVSLANMASEIGETPRAILMVSGHWEENDFAVMSSPAPGMVYDYGGFPAFTYQIKYAAPGAPAVATGVAVGAAVGWTVVGCAPAVLVGSGGATVGGAGSVAVGCGPASVGVGTMADGSAVGCPAFPGGVATVPSTGVGITSTGGSVPPPQAPRKIISAMALNINRILFLFIIIFSLWPIVAV